MGDLISKGTVLLRYQINNLVKFAPSRFIVYQNNNLTDHERDNTKHGGSTTPRISNILKIQK